MSLHSWLRSLRARSGRKTARRAVHVSVANQMAEALEPRCLLAVTPLIINGTDLLVQLESSDNVSIQADASGNLAVMSNGSLVIATPAIAVNTLTSISVFGGDGPNRIDLTNVTTAAFDANLTITVNGGDGGDTILGSEFADSLIGGNGADSITGALADDTLEGGNGSDTLSGGVGDDSLFGGDGADSIHGDAGDDTVVGGNGADRVFGDDGLDSINGGDGSDTLSGDVGDDTLSGDSGNDSLLGGADNDSILGGTGNDIASGGDGLDTLNGGADNDSLNGDAGTDSIDGGDGNDTLLGGDDNDTLNGGLGNDSLSGDANDDSLLGGSGNDTLNGSFGNDTILGNAGNDSLIGGGGSDSLDGGDGNDVVDSGDSATELVPVIISVADVSVPEGNSGTTLLTFTLRLSQPSTLPISVTVATADGTALAGSDYTRLNPTVVTFATGVITQTVTVSVSGDTFIEPGESVRLMLSSPVNARLQNNEAIGTIANDDSTGGRLLAADLNQQLYDVNPATATATQIATLGFPNFPIDLILDHTGRIFGLNRVNAANGTLHTINPLTGQTTFVANVTGVPNFTEGDMAFDTISGDSAYVAISIGGNPHLYRVNLVTGVGTDLGNITVGGANLANNNDLIEFDYLAMRNGLLYAVVDGTVTGVNANFNDALFTIDPATLAATRIGPLGVNLVPNQGSLEYDATADNFLLADGNTGNLYRVNPLTGAATFIGNNGRNGITSLVFTGVSPQSPLRISVGDVSLSEGDSGTTLATFTLTLSDLNYFPVTVNFATANGTATAGTDYLQSSGTVTFPRLTGMQTVTLPISGDLIRELNETFFLTLTNPSGAVIADGSGIATILDDESLQPDTLLGGNGNDALIGSASNDFINGEAGNDSILGNNGDDSILGGAGNDTINGGNGNDTLNGQGGNDAVAGGDGSDTYVWNGAGDGVDTLSSLSGYDRVRVQGTDAANNYVVSQVSGQLQITDGTAVLNVSPIIQVVDIFAGLGNDRITINALDRVRTATVLTVNGEDGNDKINSNGANLGFIRVSLVGGLGDDTLVGGSGIDSLDGGDGDDVLDAQGGNDLVFGGIGDDTIVAGAGNDRVLAGDGNDYIEAGLGDDSVAGELGADTISGSDGNDTLDGGEGTDTINGGSGNDSILGGNEADYLNGSTGNDTVRGGASDDTIIGENGNDSLFGEDGNDSILGYDGDDTLSGGDGDDTIDGMAGNDLIGGGNGDDLMNGAAGNDTLTGGDGNDTMAGGAGNDVLLGDEGDDSLNGQGSTDIINPGEGANTVIDPITEIDTTFVLSAALLAALA